MPTRYATPPRRLTTTPRPYPRTHPDVERERLKHLGLPLTVVDTLAAPAAYQRRRRDRARRRAMQAA